MSNLLAKLINGGGGGSPGDAGIINPGTNKGYAAPTVISLDARIASILSNVIGLLTLIAGLAFLFYFIFGAINWVTSAGDPKKIETSRQTILNAIIGLVVTVIAYPLLSILGHFIGIDLANPAELIKQIKFTP